MGKTFVDRMQTSAAPRFNWHSWEIYVYSLVALLKLGYFLVVGPIKHKQTVSSKTTCFRFLCFCFAVGKFGSVGG